MGDLCHAAITNQEAENLVIDGAEQWRLGKCTQLPRTNLVPTLWNWAGALACFCAWAPLGYCAQCNAEELPLWWQDEVSNNRLAQQLLLSRHMRR